MPREALREEPQVQEEVEEGVMEVLVESEGHESFDGSDISGW